MINYMLQVMAKKHLDNQRPLSNKQIGQRVLKTINKSDTAPSIMDTLKDYNNKQQVNRLVKEYYKSNKYKYPASGRIEPSNLEFDLLTLGSGVARNTIKKAYKASIPYVQKGLTRLGQMLTPSTYMGNLDPVVKALADASVPAAFGANSIESMRRVGPNVENVTGLATSLAPFVSGGKAFNEFANAFMNDLKGTNWYRGRALSKVMNEELAAKTASIPTSEVVPNTISLRYAPPSVRTMTQMPRSSRISEAERLGIPKSERAGYHTIAEDKAFKQQIVDFANKYGYDISDIPKGAPTKELERYARDLIAKHNSYYRGVEMPTLSSDKALLEARLGSNPTVDEIYQSMITTPRPNDVLWISPGANAGIYGGGGRTGIVSRPYSLGTDRTQWFDEGDFIVNKGYNFSGSGLADPWASDKYIYGPDHIPSELVSKTPMIFRGFAKSPLKILSRNKYKRK